MSTARLRAFGRFEYRQRDRTIGDRIRHYPIRFFMLAFLTLVALVGLGIAGFQKSNALALAREQVFKCRADVVGVLQKRFDVLSGLLTLALDFKDYERTMLRAAEEHALGKVSKMSSGGARMLITNMDTQYPQLRANEPYQTMMSQLLAVENEVDQRFRDYNEAVKTLNAALQTLSGGMVGRSIMNFEPQAYLDASMADTLLPRELDLAALRSISKPRLGSSEGKKPGRSA